MNFLEIQFSLRGQTLPADHGFSLYSALKNLCHKQQPTLLNDNNLSSDVWFFVTWYGSIRGQKSAKSLSGKGLN
jgi:hypothetical protein